MRTLVCIGVLLLSVGASLAQGDSEVRQEIAAGRAEIQANRQAVVGEALPLTEEEAKVFWPMFREYRGEMAKVGDRFVELVLNYAKNLDTMTDAQAAAMLDESLAIQKEELKIKQSWLPKFRKVLSPKSVMRFYQIESKLDTILRFEAAAQIPLVESVTK